MNKIVLFLTLVVLCCNSEAARILGVFPTPSISHQVVFRAVYTELVKRGHELVVITPDPIYKNETGPKNLKEINLDNSYEMILDRNDPLWKTVQRGVILDARAWLYQKPDPFLRTATEIFKYKEVNDLITNKNQTFDLVIYEPLNYVPLIFCEIYKAPAIMLSSFYGSADNYETVGAIGRHPILHPNSFRTKFRNLNIFEKIYQLYIEYEFYQFYQRHKDNTDEYFKEQFGEVPPVRDLIKKYVKLFFSNSHPIFDGNRPVPPGVVYLGALHMKPVKELPEDLKLYLDNSKRGVIYVSLGTNVRPSLMDSDMLNAFLEAFAALPYDILWKFDGDNLDGVSQNVKIAKWFPQRDLLGHPNIRLFITQGGLQSTDEAIDSGVPLVGIPFVVDQWFNVNKYVELGIGVEVDTFTITASDIVKAVNTVLHDQSYRKNIQQLREVMKDQKESALERAVWWTEYVLRHKDSRHLLAPAADLTWSEYLMADVVLALAVVLLIIALISLVIFYNIIKVLLFVNRSIKLKKD